MANIYDLNGNIIEVGGGSGAVEWDRTVKSIAHRGYSTEAPENTLPAYKLARKNGFWYVETDVEFTSDNVPVLLHDPTIDRTSNGSGNIHELTWAQVQQYDFGSWKSSAYAGTKIPSFAQFIKLCKDLMLHPYIELKSGNVITESQIRSLVDIVDAHGMKGKVTWISFFVESLTYVKNYDASARLGFVIESVSTANINTALGLKTTTNDVFLDSSHKTAEAAATARAAGLPMEIWTVDAPNVILGLDPYITGVTGNYNIAGKIIYENAIEG